MNEAELITTLNSSLDLTIPSHSGRDELFKQLSAYINHLIQTDFQRLVYLLYRIDVSEARLKNILEHSDRDAGTIISELIIERQEQKIESRKKFSPKRSDNSEEEW